MLRDTIVSQQVFNQDINGILKFYDNSRSMWISVAREVFSFGINHRDLNHSRYMFTAGKVATMSTGYRVPRDAVVTSITAQTRNSATCGFKLRKNNSATDLYTLSLSSEQGKTQDNLAILTVDEDDWMQIFMNITGSNLVDFPVVDIELGWR